MATQKMSPLAQMKEKFKDKESLVDRLLEVIERGGEEKDDLKARLLAASNKKLLRLFEVASEIKSKWGDRAKLAEALASLMGKAKDQPYIAKLASYTPARLLDLYHAVEKRTKRAGASASA